jgi:hypothetical protein
VRKRSVAKMYMELHDETVGTGLSASEAQSTDAAEPKPKKRTPAEAVLGVC